MPEEVQKRGNRGIEKFDINKLRSSIEKASRETSYSEEKISFLVEEMVSYVMNNISHLQRIDTQSLRTLILNKLDELYPEVAEAWRKYDREVKGRED
ncbi:MAG: ATP cone domain-containing protein [Patescibacteria group bacterium]|nr:ATP cone domain-containing protein [Patescibacteria group bacterium]